MAAAKHTELPAVTVPSHLWMRSGRPVEGRVAQIAIPSFLILAALLASDSGATLRIGLVLAGAGLFLAMPTIVLGRLERLGREVQAADPATAALLLQSLPSRPVVRFFAPYAWRTLQDGILQLKLGDGRAAAANFVETARLVNQPEAVMLISAQAHALVLAGERTEAYNLLQRLAKENLLGSRDQLDLGIVLLIESQKKNKQALTYIEAARKTIGDHPRVLAALALALQKTERIDEASELLEQVQISLQGGEADPLVEDLVKRARKGLQVFIEAQLRRERRSRSRRTTIVVSSDLAASEIVSGEIGAGSPEDQAQLDNPTTSFRPADTGAPSVISSKSVDGKLTSEERTMLNLPNSPTRRAEDARASAFSIEEGEVEEAEEAEPVVSNRPEAKPVVAKAEPTSAQPAKPVTGKQEPVSAAQPPPTPAKPVTGKQEPVSAAQPPTPETGKQEPPSAKPVTEKKEPVSARPPSAKPVTEKHVPVGARSGLPSAKPVPASPRKPEPVVAPARNEPAPAKLEPPSAKPEPPPAKPEPPAKLEPTPLLTETSGPFTSSLFDSLFNEPEAPASTGNISLINPAVAVPSPPPSDLSKILAPLAPPLPPEPAPSRPAPKSPAEVDVPVFRRKPAGADRANQLGNLPTGGNSGGPLSSLPVAGGAKPPALPTRAPTSAAPKSTTPMFRAPVPGKSGDGDPNDESGRH